MGQNATVEILPAVDYQPTIREMMVRGFFRRFLHQYVHITYSTSVVHAGTLVQIEENHIFLKTTYRDGTTIAFKIEGLRNIKSFDTYGEKYELRDFATIPDWIWRPYGSTP